MSGHDENVEAVSNRCDCGERQTMSHLMTCDDAPNCTMDRLGYLNPCRCQLWQTLGGIYLTAVIEDSTKKIILFKEVYSPCCHYVMGACYIRRLSSTWSLGQWFEARWTSFTGATHCTIDEATQCKLHPARRLFVSTLLSCILDQDRLEGHQRWTNCLGWLFHCLACHLFSHIVSCCYTISPCYSEHHQYALCRILVLLNSCFQIHNRGFATGSAKHVYTCGRHTNWEEGLTHNYVSSEMTRTIPPWYCWTRMWSASSWLDERPVRFRHTHHTLYGYWSVDWHQTYNSLIDHFLIMQHFATQFDMLFLVMHSHNWLSERII